MELYHPAIARKRKAGQFVVVRSDEKAERIPLTIADSDPTAGTITLIYQEVGVSTRKLGLTGSKAVLADVVGPLGKPTEIKDYGTVMCIGGGIGAAVAYPQAKALKEAGNEVLAIVGARSKDRLILLDETEEICDQMWVTTDDGSYGRHGFVCDELSDILARGKHIDAVFAIGPVPMMRAVCEMTSKYNIETIVSLNSIMVDGTGMCGACRVTVGGRTRFVCVDGPEFNGPDVDFDELQQRLSMYLDEEKIATQHFDRAAAGATEDE
jgi:ferredoxin--NADP+ reductase